MRRRSRSSPPRVRGTVAFFYKYALVQLRQGQNYTPLGPPRSVANTTSMKKTLSASQGTMLGSNPELTSVSKENIISFRNKRKQPDPDQSISNTLHDFREELMTCFREFSKSQSEALLKLTDNVTNIGSQITDIKHDLSSFKTEVTQAQSAANARIKSLEEALVSTESSLKTVIQDLHMNDQRSRMNNLEISGVPMSKGENLHTMAFNMAAKVGIKLEVSDINYIHRVRRYPSRNQEGDSDDKESGDGNRLPPNIIIRFLRRQMKNDFLAAVRARRGLTTADLGFDGASRPVFVNDHLTPQNKMLYRSARHLGRDKGYRYIWLNDCKIFLRKNDASKYLIISCDNDLLKIK